MFPAFAASSLNAGAASSNTSARFTGVGRALKALPSMRAISNKSSTSEFSRSTSSRQLTNVSRISAGASEERERDLDLSFKNRQGSAQFMGGVRAESAHSAKRALQSRQHVVEHGRQSS